MGTNNREIRMMSEATQEKYYSVAQASAVLGISKPMVKYYIERGRFQTAVRSGLFQTGIWLIEKAEVDSVNSQAVV